MADNPPRMASKRGARRRRQSRARRSPPPPPAPPRRLLSEEDWDRARAEKRMIAMPPTDLPQAEQEARRRQLEDRLAQARREFGPAKTNLQAALGAHDAFDLLAAMQIRFSQDSAQARTHPLHGVQASPELLALLLVERGQRARTVAPGDETSFVDALKRFESFAHITFSITPEALAPLPIPADESPEAALAELRNRMTAMHLLMPLHETDAQADLATAELFDDPLIRAHLQAELGLDAGQVLRLTDSVSELTKAGFARAIEASTTTRSWMDLGERFSSTLAELAGEAGIETEQARKFLERFSLTFDSSPVGFAPLTTRARHQPLLRDGERFMPISIPTLRRVLRSSLAALLNPDVPGAGGGSAKAFAAFSARRGTWLERRSVSVLSEALSPDWAESNIHFSLPGGRRGEIDALLRLDDTLLAVQAKAGATRIDTEASDPVRFRKTMVEMLGGKNLRQHREAAEVLALDSPRLTLDQAGREPLVRKLAGIKRVVQLHVTLENLAGVGAQPWLLSDAGLSEDRDLPWIVAIGQLELLLEYFELPAVFIHFVLRRLRANRTAQLLAQDEIDWAVRYGDDELTWADLPPDHPYTERQFAVLAEHEDFDEWVVNRQAGLAARRPRPNLPSALKKMLARIDRSRPPGWLGFCLSLLDLPQDSRIEVTKLWQHQMRSDRRSTASPLVAAFGSGEKPAVGFSVLREEREWLPHGGDVLREYCARQLIRHEAERWCAVVVPFERDGKVPWCACVGA